MIRHRPQPIMVYLSVDEQRALRALKRHTKRNTSSLVRELIVSAAERHCLVKRRLQLTG